MGMVLALGVVKETGMMTDLSLFLQKNGISSMLIGLSAGIVSMVLDNFATAASYTTLQSSSELNMAYWKIVAYTTSVGGNLLTIGSVAGLVLMRMEKVRVGWYFRNIGWKAGVGALVGTGVLLLTLA